MGDITGKAFQVMTWGESHGPAIGCVVSGCPPGLELSVERDIQPELDRRKPGQSKITTQRKEEDVAIVESGVYQGLTTGTPITIRIENKDAHSKDYPQPDVPRPNHADYTYDAKYGIRDHRGGGRSSNRIFAAYVAAGAIAQKFLHERHRIEIVGYVQQVKDIAGKINLETVSREQVEQNIVRCPDQDVTVRMIEAIEKIRKMGDSIGGIVGCVIRNVPPGLGEPLADKLQADLAKAVFTIGAVHGFEYGSGFRGVAMTGKDHNDLFYFDGQNRIRTSTNNSGGIQGGISNGMSIYFQVAFKPTATIMIPQGSVNLKTLEEETYLPRGRHDPCVVPRAVPNVEAMAALVLADHSIIRYGNARI